MLKTRITNDIMAKKTQKTIGNYSKESLQMSNLLIHSKKIDGLVFDILS